MAVKLRLARFGAKKNPYYHIVASDSRSPRDGKYIETVGKYNPMLEGNDSVRTKLIEDKVKYWLGVGAEPTDKVQKILANLGLVAKKERTVQTKKHLPKAKAQERLKASAEAIKVEAPAEEVAA
jgi:small subunit ribosomal protein S16